MTDRSLSIIVPAYNEAGNIMAAISDVLWAASAAHLTAFEVIIVNDGSTDDTGEQASLWRLCHPNIRVVHHAQNRGLRAAYESGLASARHDYVTWAPGDGEMSPASLALIFRAIGTADLVVPYHGTPERRPWFRRLLTWGSTMQLNWLLGHRLHYYQGPAVYPTKLARRLPRTESGFFCMAEMLAWALEEGLSYTLVPLEHQERQYGASKAISWSKIWVAQKLILKLAYRIHVARQSARPERTLAEV